MDERVIIEVPDGAGKTRLEDFLLDRFRWLSKMYLRDVVKRELCEVNGRPENVGYRLRGKDLIEIVLDSARETSMLPECIALDIVHEDNDLIVINKPAGMLVHPSHRENNGTLLNGLSYHLNKVAGDRLVRPGLPHRLDKQTSGLIVIAKNARSHRILSGHFMGKRVEKRYVALVEGVLERDEGTIVAPIGRYDELKQWSVKADGKHSESKYRVLERHPDASLIELEPVTGRTNQLRIHCEHIGHPIVGDVRRGGRAFDRLCLHAQKLRFSHPTGNSLVTFTSDIAFSVDT